jgi:hypothetical protein
MASIAEVESAGVGIGLALPVEVFGLSMEVSMRTLRRLLVLPLVLTTVMSSNAFAQQRHIVDAAAMANAVSQHVVEQEAKRSIVRDALARPQVKEIAAMAGVDVERLTASVAVLDDQDLNRAAASAGQINDTLAGGASTIVISTTTVIIVLLLILLLVAVAD